MFTINKWFKGLNKEEIKDERSEDLAGNIQELSTENRNYLRKVFLKTLKRTLILKTEVENRINKEMARQAKIDDISIPVFDGKNYSAWKFRILNILEYKECDDPARTFKEEAGRDATWKKLDLKSRTIIVSAISDKQLEYISKCKTAFEMMQQLDKMYSTQSTALQIINRNKLDQVKLKDYNTIEEFFCEFEKACNDFTAAGGTLTDEEKMRYMIKALPSNYSYIGDLIDLVPEAQRSVELIKSKIKEKSLSRNQSENSTASTFNVDTRNDVHTSGQRYFKGGQQNYQGRGYYSTQQSQRGSFYAPTAQRGSHHTPRGQRGPSRGYFRGQSRSRFPGQRREAHVLGPTSSENHQDMSHNLWLAQVAKINVNQVRPSESKNMNEIEWLLDSGCTDHIINNENYFYEYVTLDSPVDVNLPDGKILKATKFGQVKTYFKNYYNEVEIDLKDVYYVEGIKRNLLSFSKITKGNTIVARGNTAKIYNKNRKLTAVATKIDGLYSIKSMLKENNNNICANTVKLTDKEKWHRALGHINFQYLNKLVVDKLVDGLPAKLENVNMQCANCIQSKMANVPFANERTKSTEILELIHTDLNGPHRTTGYRGEKYFLTFIDDYSKCAKIYCIKHKSETAYRFKEFVNLVENTFNKTIKKLQCDNAKEYLNNEIYNFARQKGIQILPCPPYVHQLNGVAERYNRSVMDLGRCLAREAKIHSRYWPEITTTVAYLKNRTIANTIENKTPYEIFFGRKPDVKHLKIYGSKVFVRTPEVLRKGKWDDKAKVGTLVGYNDNSYRVLLNHKVINARHVKVIENENELICLEKLKNDEDEYKNDFTYLNLQNNEYNNNVETENFENSEIIEIDQHEQNETVKNNKQNVQVPRISQRKKSPVERYGNPMTHVIYINNVDVNVPNTYEEAINCSESREWQKAMDKEIQSIRKNKTWIVVNKPNNKRVIDVKWIFKKKNDGEYKARVVARGFQQTDYIENVYSPVGKMQTLKILLSYCCVNHLYIEQMDAETAFLNGIVKSEVYTYEPEGYETGENKVCKLQKALYGLSESPRAWYDCLNSRLEKLNFVRSKYDYCLYVNKTSKDPIYILVFVDDFAICCKDKRKIELVKTSLKESFSMKDMGKIKSYIGIDIDYTEDKRQMSLSQTKYIESLAIKYNLEYARLYNTPMEYNLKLSPAEEVDVKIKYRNLIGELLYLSMGTRPDITYSVNYLSRFQNCYTNTHFMYALRVLKYLYLTKDLKLTYFDNLDSEKLDCMVDSDFAGDNVDRKSTTGFAIRLYGNLIFWKTHKQSTVTKCSTFAEYTAMSEAVTEILFVKNLLIDSFDVEIEKPITLYEDNSGAVAIAKFGNFTKNSKHIEVQYHYINENYENGIIDIVKIDSKSNLADILTKSLNKLKFEANRKALNLI